MQIYRVDHFNLSTLIRIEKEAFPPQKRKESCITLMGEEVSDTEFDRESIF